MQIKRVKTEDVYPSEGNPRADFGDIDALAESLALNPAHPGEPLTPPLLVQDGGVYRIVDGERRWRAMRKAGTREFDAIVAEDWDDADAALAMLATDDKKALTEVERSRGVQRCLLIGVEPEKVEKAARKKGLGRVKRAAGKLGAEAETMTLDHLLAVDELSGRPELAARVAGADEAHWEREYGRAKAQLERERLESSLRERFAELGIDLEEDGAADTSGMSYAWTVRDPSQVDADEAGGISAAGGAFVLKTSEADGCRVVAYEPAGAGVGVDPATLAALEEADALHDLARRTVESISERAVSLALDGPGCPRLMALAVQRELGDPQDQWSGYTAASEWLDGMSYDGPRPDGTATGMLAASLIYRRLSKIKPSSGALKAACGVPGDVYEPYEYDFDSSRSFMELFDAAVADGYLPWKEDARVVATLRAWLKSLDGEENEEEEE